MNLDHFIAQLANQAEIIHASCRTISQEQARWKPNPESWSVLEVINHLYDEEREDFRAHLDLILHRPDHLWSSINPQGWVIERNYNQRDFEESVRNFMAEREKSLTWLGNLFSPNWQITCQAPFGQITAGDMLASWLAHDLLHLRQLVELHWAFTIYSIQPYKVDYAGEW